MHRETAPRLYIVEHSDGAGHRMKSILEAMAVGWRNQMNFGGLVAWKPLTDQHIDFRQVVDAVFGMGASRQLFRYSRGAEPRYDASFEDVRGLQGKEIEPRAQLYVHAVHEWTLGRKA